MNIHEYQAKQLLAREGVVIPDGRVARTPEEAKAVAEELATKGHTRFVIKAQIHAGGRGKGTFKNGVQGGVRVLNSVEEIYERARVMLGQVLVTKQTGPDGRLVRFLLIDGAPDIRKEIYMAVLLDRAAARPLLMASTEGGMDIEDVAAKTPEKIIKEWIDPAVGMMPYQARKIASKLGLRGELMAPAVKLLTGAYNAWWKSDASLLEINPLCIVATREGKQALMAVDAKISIDDNALYRQKELTEMRDLNEESPLETEASNHNLSYIKLDGNIACLVNGAGLAMATMDVIQHFGGQPANFLDVGGGASQEQVTAAFQIILKDPNVRGILVNIFGGIMQCDIIARGIVASIRETHLTLPLVVRLEGNSADSGKKILAESKLSIINGESMADAAEKVVKAVAG
ncbi:MAG: ADP-forming succinate--CoA ligase subunit beta [Verrucomicrobiia bacterium]